mmetsp:Transcript_34330/g.71467  ORF Transcript_34330/g.71467 Transcript_34330/m.71467 type:complete len:352 (-) Transcript_34330:47-1102(-)
MAQYATTAGWPHHQVHAQLQQQPQFPHLLWPQPNTVLATGSPGCFYGGWQPPRQVSPLCWVRAGTPPRTPPRWEAPRDPLVQSLIEELGIEPSEENDFAWIAEYGAQDEALPAPWERHFDPATGCAYYVDADTQESTWDCPLIPCLRRVLQSGRRYLTSPSEGFFEEQKVQLWERLKADLDCWYGPLESPEGRAYFAHSLSGHSSWRDPRVDTQFLFDLEGGLLDSLAEMLPPPEELQVPCFGSRELREAASFWRADTGAEVLTLGDPQEPPGDPLDPTGTPTPRMPSKLEVVSAAAQKDAASEKKQKLKSMRKILKRLDGMLEEGIESQRRQIHTLYKARSCRMEGLSRN